MPKVVATASKSTKRCSFQQQKCHKLFKGSYTCCARIQTAHKFTSKHFDSRREFGIICFRACFPCLSVIYKRRLATFYRSIKLQNWKQRFFITSWMRIIAIRFGYFNIMLIVLIRCNIHFPSQILSNVKSAFLNCYYI